jgi:predicted dehydrogenase
MDRRTFVKTGIAGLAAAATGGRAFAAGQDKAKRVALIGCGWYGKNDLFRLLQVTPAEVVSLADPDRKMLAEAGEMVAARQASKKVPRLHADWREVVKAKDFDIAVIGTPDHWHALTAIEAMKAGADVYCQKPISVDVVEGQAMVAAARKYGRVVQVGTQRRSTPHLVEARDRVIKEGKLGKVGLVEIYCYYHMRARDNPPDAAPPEHLDYEMWTGPAPMRPYNPLVHPRRWRAFMEYGNGIVGDMCIHMLDMVRWLLDLGWPKRVSSTGGILMDKASKSNIADTQTAVFEFDGFPVVWQHRTWGSSPDPKYPWGATIYGDKGTLKASVNTYDFFLPGRTEPALHGDWLNELEKYPEDKTEKDLEKHVASANRAHQRDFLAAIASRGKPVADVEQGHISSASCILANLSMQLGRSLAWDPAKHEVPGDLEANRLLRRPYRAPWVHPEPDTV